MEIISWLDDHARYALRVTAHVRVTGPIVLATFRQAADLHGYPGVTLTDNGMVYTTRLSGGSLRGTRGRNGFETELHQLGIVQKNSRPNHPTTCGKVERFQQTLKKWLRAQTPSRPRSPNCRPSSTPSPRLQPPAPAPLPPAPGHPATIYNARPKATPTAAAARNPRPDPHGQDRQLRHRHPARRRPLRHIGVGRTHARTYVLLLVQDLEVRVIDAATGELLRELTIDPSRDYQPPADHPGPPRK